MDTLDSYEGRRTLVQSILSTPPSIITVVEDLVGTGNKVVTPSSTTPLICYLCHYSPDNNDSWDEDTSFLVRETMKTLMAQVGLDLGNHPSFCPFCSSQLQTLVGLSREMERLQERLVRIIDGLQNLLCPPDNAQNDEGEVDDSPVFLILANDDDEMMTVTDGSGNDELLLNQEEEEGFNFEIVEDDGVVTPEEEDRTEETSQSGSGDGLVIDEDDDDDEESVVEELPKLVFCSICQKGFRRKENLQQHLLGHTGERRYPCTLCEKKFIYSRNLTAHLKTHLPEDEKVRPHACSLCPRRFPGRPALERHVRCHIPGPQRPYKCDHCARRFIQKAHLKQHAKTHLKEEEKPWPCHLCSKTFTRKAYLQGHMGTHLPDVESTVLFVCSICPSAGFGKKAELDKHMEGHMNGEIEETQVQSPAEGPSLEELGRLKNLNLSMTEMTRALREDSMLFESRVEEDNYQDDSVQDAGDHDDDDAFSGSGHDFEEGDEEDMGQYHDYNNGQDDDGDGNFSVVVQEPYFASE